MTTTSHTSGNSAHARTMNSGPYAGPHRRPSDDARAVEAAIARAGSAALGPYLPAAAGSALERAGLALATTSASIAVAAAGVAFLQDTSAIDSDDLSQALPFASEHKASLESVDDSFGVVADSALPPVAATAELPWITTFLDDVTPVSTANSSEATLAPSDWFDAEASIEQLVAAENVSSEFIAVEKPAAEFELVQQEFANSEFATDELPSEELAPFASAFGVSESNDEIEAELHGAWDADGVGAEMRAIADALSAHIAPALVDATEPAWLGEAGDAVTEVAESEPLAMWADDDFPATTATSVLDVTVEAESLAIAAAALESAEQLALAQESAAAALESLAQRVRSGDLEILGFRADQGDAAAVAAALAALLGAPRRG